MDKCPLCGSEYECDYADQLTPNPCEPRELGLFAHFTCGTEVNRESNEVSFEGSECKSIQILELTKARDTFARICISLGNYYITYRGSDVCPHIEDLCSGRQCIECILAAKYAFESEED